jgi:hypothetical protein
MRLTALWSRRHRWPAFEDGQFARMSALQVVVHHSDEWISYRLPLLAEKGGKRTTDPPDRITDGLLPRRQTGAGVG